MGSDQHYSLRWNDYTLKIVTAFQSLRDEEDFVDVTVACDGHHYSAHKMVLSACSPFFRSLLRANPCQHPIVILKDVGHTEMERLLEFMYNGEVNIAQDQLAAFLRTAECLRIRGLAGSSEDIDNYHMANMNPRDSTLSQVIGVSGVTTVIGGSSGRNSPSNYSVGPDPQRDEDIAIEPPCSQSSSPLHKRRKRAHQQPDIGASQSSGENFHVESADRANCSGEIVGTCSGSMGLDDDLKSDNKSELKHEPADPLAEVYTDSSDMGTDPTSIGDPLGHRQNVIYPLAMAGTSGAALSVQDGISGNESGGLPDLGNSDASTMLSGSIVAPFGGFHWSQNSTSQQASRGSSASDNQCVFCHKVFSNRGSMTRHLRDQHLQPGATVTCDICGKVCKNRNCLITHRSVAHNGRRRSRVLMQGTGQEDPSHENGVSVDPLLCISQETASHSVG